MLITFAVITHTWYNQAIIQTNREWSSLKKSIFIVILTLFMTGCTSNGSPNPDDTYVTAAPESPPPTAAATPPQSPVEDFGYTVHASRTDYMGRETSAFVEITKYTGPGGHVVVPAMIEGVPVTTIGEWAFHSNETLISVILPESLLYIQKYAFAYNNNLVSVDLPYGLLEIGFAAFIACISLIDISLPDSLVVLDALAFDQCESLTSITILGGVEEIGGYAFRWCTSLSSVTIEEGVQIINSYAFAYCSALTSIVIPGSVEIIWSGAFHHTSLESVFFEGDAPYINEWPFPYDAHDITFFHRENAHGWDDRLEDNWWESYVALTFGDCLWIYFDGKNIATW
jgi:hypothetical protein